MLVTITWETVAWFFAGGLVGFALGATLIAFLLWDHE